ncbi:PIG-L family deacetylase [Flavobacteriaceae bacterium]|nr:PIG-L family deacetylase [Flavobacteriaceae bacterium]
MKETKNKLKILAIAPHADDVEIGMGGSIRKFVSEGHNVKILNLIIPCEDSDGNSCMGRKEIRRSECVRATKILGAELEIFDLDPYDFNYSRKYIKIFDQYIKNYAPDQIYITWEGDTHQDHQTLSKIIYSATRKNNCSLYMYETMLPGGITSNTFHPQCFVNISSTIDYKIKSLESYNSVFSDNNYIDAIVGRSKFRGGQIGVSFAESFRIIKQIIY